MCDKGHFKIIAHILTNGAMEEILSGKVHFIFITSHLVGQSLFTYIFSEGNTGKGAQALEQWG